MRRKGDETGTAGRRRSAARVGQAMVASLGAVALLAAGGAAGASGGAEHLAARPATPPVHGYDEHWLFNANDGTPIAHVDVARNGTFSFHYLPSYCGTGSFAIHGVFESTHLSLIVATGYAVAMTVSGFCDGKGQSAGNVFTWSKPQAVSPIDKWPDSRAVQGEMVQTAVDGTARGNIEIDLSMSAN